MKEFLRALKYTLIAASAGIIQFLSFEIISRLFNAVYEVSYFISLVLSVVWNLTINRKATFKSNASYGISLLLVVDYYTLFTPISVYGGGALVDIGWNETLVFFISLFVNFITEYLYMTFVVFAGSKDSIDNKGKTEETITKKVDK